jgi:hypothetical protein
MNHETKPGVGNEQKTPLLKLLALDAEDLAVVSANLQDAIVRLGDMAFLPDRQIFALVMSRFDWEGLLVGRRERRQTGVHFARVRRVTYSKLPRERADVLLNLLSLSFETNDPPSGIIRLTFSGGAAIRLHVECIEAEMRDLGPRWRAKAIPGHPVDEAQPDRPRSSGEWDAET